MDEEEWLHSWEPENLIAFLLDRVSDRKLRLFAVNACRLCEELRETSALEGWIGVIERYADCQVPDDDLREVYASACSQALTYSLAGPSALHVGTPEGEERYRKMECHLAVSRLAVANHTGPPLNGYVERSLDSVLPRVGVIGRTLLHDIFGNPFRPVAVDAEWLTSTVVQLARGIYEERAFDRMPILADALQDAGCDNDDVLTHCRDESATHVRGCWVVDLLLGKT